uniref:COMM domain-containing protein 5 n=1 Tax=Bos taurus TaxID=9913 RepID=Q32P90_BOVIN|nr:COMMD5 protein [Bos taurus]
MSAVGPAAAHLHRPGDSHSDCVSFLGAQLPPEVAAMPQLLGEDCREAVQHLRAGANLPEEQLGALMHLKLSDGSALRFEVPTAKFQELRFAVALVLKEMADLEKRCERKLQD